MGKHKDQVTAHIILCCFILFLPLHCVQLDPPAPVSLACDGKSAVLFVLRPLSQRCVQLHLRNSCPGISRKDENVLILKTYNH